MALEGGFVWSRVSASVLRIRVQKIMELDDNIIKNKTSKVVKDKEGKQNVANMSRRSPLV